MLFTFFPWPRRKRLKGTYFTPHFAAARSFPLSLLVSKLLLPTERDDLLLQCPRNSLNSFLAVRNLRIFWREYKERKSSIIKFEKNVGKSQRCNNFFVAISLVLDCNAWGHDWTFHSFWALKIRWSAFLNYSKFAAPRVLGPWHNEIFGQI